jgi:hypothetical protein
MVLRGSENRLSAASHGFAFFGMPLGPLAGGFFTASDMDPMERI